MKGNVYRTPFVLRSGADAMRQHGAPVQSVGRLLALADVAEHQPAQFARLAGAVLVGLVDEPANTAPGRVELAAYRAAYGEAV